MLFYTCGKYLLVPAFKKIFSCCNQSERNSNMQTDYVVNSMTQDNNEYEINVITNAEKENIEMSVVNKNESDFNKYDGDVCMECRVIKVFAIIIPCEHECLCLECGEKYRNEKRSCPICQIEIETVWPK